MAANGVTTVLFDLDDTLCVYSGSFDDRLSAAFERAGIEPFFDAADVNEAVRRIDADSRYELQVRSFRALAEERGRDLGKAKAFADAYEDPAPEDVEFCRGAAAVLDGLGERYRLGLVSNGGTERQRVKLESLGVRDRFDAVVCAEPGRPVKPDPEPFQRALDALGVTPAECVHVGNSLECDVAGAQAAGIDAVWIPEDGQDVTALGSGDPEPEHVVESLADLMEPPWE
jgi:putative hydrolase of the HAD superfamily